MDEVANLLAKHFIERRDVKAWQQPDGAYYPDETPITRADLLAHLSGTKSMGHYVVDKATGRARIFCFDLDLAKTATLDGQEVEPRAIWKDRSHPLRGELVKQLANLSYGLARYAHRILEIPVAVTFSGSKGMHVYGLVGSQPADDIRAVALGLIDQLGCFEPVEGRANTYRHADGVYPALEFEVFPKTGDLGSKKFGYLLRVPLGVNRRGGPSMFIRFDESDPTRITKLDPAEALSGGKPW